jgi:hypothetical protein
LVLPRRGVGRFLQPHQHPRRRHPLLQRRGHARSKGRHNRVTGSTRLTSPHKRQQTHTVTLSSQTITACPAADPSAAATRAAGPSAGIRIARTRCRSGSASERPGSAHTSMALIAAAVSLPAYRTVGTLLELSASLLSCSIMLQCTQIWKGSAPRSPVAGCDRPSPGPKAP